MKTKTTSPKKEKVLPTKSAVPSSIPQISTGRTEPTRPSLIQACMIFYNDTPQLMERALQAIRPAVDKIICIDGAFAEFPHVKPWSTDGCLDIAKAYADEVVECKEPWKDQMTKRSRYFTLTDPNDYYLLYDTDELFRGTIPRNLGEDCYSVAMEDFMEDGTKSVVDRFRLIRHQPGIAHKFCHAEIWVDDRPLVVRRRKRPFAEIKGFTIEHHPYLRPTIRQELDAKYMAIRAENKRLDSPFNNLGYIPEETCVRMMFKGTHYAGDDGFGKTFVATPGNSYFMSHAAAKGVMESWPMDWEKLEEYNVPAN